MCEAAWLKRILEDLDVPFKDPILLYYDNMSSINLARNTVFHTQTKHIEVHNHFIRKRFLVGDISHQCINFNLQTVNIFTKALVADNLRYFAKNLGLSTANQPSLGGVRSVDGWIETETVNLPSKPKPKWDIIPTKTEANYPMTRSCV